MSGGAGSTKRGRLDAAVAKQLGVSRAKSAAMVMAGEVRVDGRPGQKPGQAVAGDAVLEHTARSPDVSRAAGKLAPVLKEWGIPAKGLAALDVGASTGGFTQTLLAAGARLVYAVDVGTGQLDWSLRQNPNVVSLERTDIRSVEQLREKLTDPPQLAVVDVSFISLRLVLPAVARLLPPAAPVVALFKPQFEVGKAAASRSRGVITDQALIGRTLTALLERLVKTGWAHRATLPSEVAGSKGNRELLVWLVTPAAVPTAGMG